MDKQSSDAKKAILTLLTEYGDNCMQVAKHLNIHYTHVYRARHGDITPTLKAALINRGLIPEPETRVRFCGDVAPDLHDKMVAEAQRLKMTHGEYLAYLYGDE